MPRPRLALAVVVLAVLGFASALDSRPMPRAEAQATGTNEDPLKVQSRYTTQVSAIVTYRQAVATSDSASLADTFPPVISLLDGRTNLAVEARFSIQGASCQLVCVRGVIVHGTGGDYFAPLAHQTIAVVSSGQSIFGGYVPDNTAVFDTVGGTAAYIRVIGLTQGTVTLSTVRQ